ncbi:MAG: cupin domain-containing protein, partial [Candidatus Lutacidiplasmatales archaeon]
SPPAAPAHSSCPTTRVRSWGDCERNRAATQGVGPGAGPRGELARNQGQHVRRRGVPGGSEHRGRSKNHRAAPPAPTEDEAWYVLEGELAVELDGRVVRAGPGGAAWSGPMVVHTVWNPSVGPTRYMLILGPKTRELLLALNDGNPPNLPGIRGIADSSGIDLLE